MIIAAMNPCPCGYYGHPSHRCTCSSSMVSRYLTRVSGPLLDRLDLHVEVPPVEYDQLSAREKAESSEQIRHRVEKARRLQQDRYQKNGITCNARLTPDLLHQYCPLTDRASHL